MAVRPGSTAAGARASASPGPKSLAAAARTASGVMPKSADCRPVIAMTCVGKGGPDGWLVSLRADGSSAREMTGVAEFAGVAAAASAPIRIAVAQTVRAKDARLWVISAPRADLDGAIGADGRHPSEGLHVGLQGGPGNLLILAVLVEGQGVHRGHGLGIG